MFRTIEMETDIQIHNIQEFAKEEQLCSPFKCGMSRLFWYIIKVTGIVGVNQINVILNFLHSKYFNINKTPKSYKELESFEIHQNSIYM